MSIPHMQQEWGAFAGIAWSTSLCSNPCVAPSHSQTCPLGSGPFRALTSCPPSAFLLLSKPHRPFLCLQFTQHIPIPRPLHWLFPLPDTMSPGILLAHSLTYSENSSSITSKLSPFLNFYTKELSPLPMPSSCLILLRGTHHPWCAFIWCFAICLPQIESQCHEGWGFVRLAHCWNP